jgi:hypothetical protein
MKQRPKQPLPGKSPTLLASDADQIVQIKVWLLGISPMVWRRVLVPGVAAASVRNCTVACCTQCPPGKFLGSS